MFEIVRIVPIYCGITDGQIGSQVVDRSHGYYTEALAHKLAEVQANKESEECSGESSFVVVPAGACPFSPRYRARVEAECEIPF